MYGMDFSLSNEGDLQLGLEKTNERNETLYRQPNGQVTVYAKEGSKTIRDLSLIRSKKSIQQNIYVRLKTDNPDWYHHRQIGSNLSDLVGEPNTRETADKGVEYITESLTYAGFLHTSQFSIRAIPISAHEIMFLLTVMISNQEEFRMPLVFDLHRGLKEVTFDE